MAYDVNFKEWAADIRKGYGDIVAVDPVYVDLGKVDAVAGWLEGDRTAAPGADWVTVLEKTRGLVHFGLQSTWEKVTNFFRTYDENPTGRSYPKPYAAAKGKKDKNDDQPELSDLPLVPPQGFPSHAPSPPLPDWKVRQDGVQAPLPDDQPEMPEDKPTTPTASEKKKR